MAKHLTGIVELDGVLLNLEHIENPRLVRVLHERLRRDRFNFCSSGYKEVNNASSNHTDRHGDNHSESHRDRYSDSHEDWNEQSGFYCDWSSEGAQQSNYEHKDNRVDRGYSESIDRGYSEHTDHY